MMTDERERLAKAIEDRVGGLCAYVEQSRATGHAGLEQERCKGVIDGHKSAARIVREWPAEGPAAREALVPEME